MKVEIEFDKAKIEAMGYTYQQVVSTVKQLHAQEGLPCLSDGAVLTFSDRGHKEDYSNLWFNIDQLINSSWFLKCATALRWFDNNDDDLYEDVLAQADLLLD